MPGIPRVVPLYILRGEIRWRNSNALWSGIDGTTQEFEPVSFTPV